MRLIEINLWRLAGVLASLVCASFMLYLLAIVLKGTWQLLAS